MNQSIEQHGHVHTHTFTSELICHTPYAIFSVAFCLIILAFLSFAFLQDGNTALFLKGSRMLFHIFHFMHLIFAGTGVLITFFRFSKNFLKGIIVGALTTITFCTISDSILPYIGGKIMGVDMHFHLCFISEIKNVLPFLLVGLINGIIMSKNHASRQTFYSIWSHFIHIFISSLASSFYLVSHGFTDWYHHIGFVFVFLIIATVIPCTLSDVIIPMAFAKADKNNEKY
jgi:hypothetical protein